MDESEEIGKGMRQSKIENIKKCNKCGEIKSLDEFWNDWDKKYGKATLCILCRSHNNFLTRSTFDGFFTDLYNHMEQHAKSMLKGCYITLNELIDLWFKQDGRCYYSHIQMNCKPSSNWKCSPERLDPDGDYTKENTVLICNELNTKCQWSVDKIQRLIILMQQKYDTDKILEEIKEELNKVPIRKASKKIERRLINGVQYQNCSGCDILKIISEFHKGVTECKDCKYINRRKGWNTIPGKLAQLVQGAKSNTNKRKGKRTNRLDNSFNLTYEDLAGILLKQRGLCAYSGIRMNYGCIDEKEWVVSLERIDPFNGYNKDNVRLICYEFNTPDHSVNIKYSNGGNAAWNKEKFELFIKSLETKYNVQINRYKEEDYELKPEDNIVIKRKKVGSNTNSTHCECGGFYTSKSWSKHRKSQKHQRYEAESNKT